MIALLRALAGSGADRVHNTARMAASEARIVVYRATRRAGLFLAGLLVAAAGLLLALAGGALLVNLLLRGGSPRGEEPSRSDPPPCPKPAWQTALRDAAIGLVVPWLVRRVEEAFGGAPEETGESAPVRVRSPDGP